LQLRGIGKISIDMSLDLDCAPFMQCGDSRSFTRFVGTLLDLVEESTNDTQRSASHFVSDLLSFFVATLPLRANRPHQQYLGAQSDELLHTENLALTALVSKISA
jgi:hypothetical protein